MGSPFKKIDWSYRPASYVGGLDTTTRILNRIPGTARRHAAEEIAIMGTPLALTREAAAPTLPEATLRDWGRVHPLMMGGEYLPELDVMEIEIARIELGSVTGDVISIRAEEGGDGIRYRVVDEHESVFSCAIAESSMPLTMRQIVRLIDRTAATEGSRAERSLALSHLKYNLENGSDRDDLEGFVTVSSDFYPNLADWYAYKCERHLFPGRFRRGRHRPDR